VNIKGTVPEYRLLPTTRVGRDKRLVDVLVRHAHISRHHFTIHRTPDGYVVENEHKPDNNPEGSWARLRIYVNEEPVLVKRSVDEGDLITVKSEDQINEVSFRVGPSRVPGRIIASRVR